MKTWSTSFVIREMQIESIRYYCISSRISKIKDCIKYWQGCKTTGIFIHCYKCFGKEFGSFLKKVTVHLLFNLVFLLLLIYVTKTKTYIYAKTGTELDIAALFELLQTGNNPNTHQQVNG